MSTRILKAAAVLATAAALQAHAQAQTAPTANLTVVGAITPSACSIMLENSGNASFGSFSADTVQKWTPLDGPARYSGLESKQFTNLGLTVNCDGPTKFALSFVDNKLSTVAGPAGQGYSFGLGTYQTGSGSSLNVGRYVVQYDQLIVSPLAGTAAARPAVTLLTTGAAGPGSPWQAATGNEAIYLPSGKSVAFNTLAGSTTPGALVSLTGSLRFAIEPLKSVIDSATAEVPLNGSATITLITL